MRALRVRVRAASVWFCLLVSAVASSARAEDFAGRVEIGDGRHIYLECSGVGAPAVILISGYRNDAEIWTVEPAPGVTPVFKMVSAFTRVCAYDRPGTILDQTHVSRSDAVAMPRTAEAIVAELHALLQAAKVEGPIVIAAHSLGGLFARFYTSTYPDEVAGLVLVDSWQEDLPEILGAKAWKAYDEVAEPAPPGLEGYKQLEHVDFALASAIMRAAAAAHPLGTLPLYVLTRTKPVALPPNVPADFDAAAFEKAWRQGQERLIALTPTARHEIAEKSDHYIQIEQPELVIAAIRAVVEAVRNPASWPR